MKHLTIALWLLIAIQVKAQSSFNSEDNTVTRADLETNYYKKDSTANAIVLYEFGNSYVDNKTFKLVTEIKKKVKILNRSAFDKATIEEQLYREKNKGERMYDISATTYNLENGRITSIFLNDKNIFEEKYNDHYDIVKFTLPNIKEGSVITYSYKLSSPYFFKYKEWKFQDDIPKLHSEYHTSIPANWEYNIKLVGYKKLFKNESKLKKRCLEGGNGAYSDCTDAIYIMKDISAFIEEDYMTTKENYLSRIDYELKVFKSFDGRTENITKSWKTTDSEIKSMPEVGRQLGKSSMLKDLIGDGIKNEPDVLKKAIAIYKYVQDNYTWNGKYGIFKDVSVKDLIKNKSGKVSEINILLHNLLDEYGIEVMPVLLSTRDNGFPTKIYPVISDFNYLIVQATVDNKTYLLDATDGYLSFGEIPFRCLNHYGRLMDFDKGSYYIDIQPEKTSTIIYKTELSLDENETLAGTIDSRSTGYHALPPKKSYFSNKQDYLKNFEKIYPNITFLDHRVATEDKTDFDFLETFDVEYHVDNIGGNLYINPFLFKFFTENPFKLQERTYPIDFGYKDAFLCNLKLNYGEDYEVVESPVDVNYPLPNNKGSIILSSKIQDNSVLLYFKFNFNDSLYGPEYYDYLKKYLGKIVDIQKNTLIVLKKK
ncbi:MAG TPA: DUF3857 domain-containing protein [Flavobacteriaceae bacterium]